ncbi:MAG: tRNA epoxyqueuosine(34) reductase QueG [Muribaculaceae bacterium]|nr:tRNA epoxyqueuosine(34) reductase QueG [Muribaculaceae bacterium]
MNLENLTELTRDLKTLAMNCGCVATGVCEISVTDESDTEIYNRWIDAGRHGKMEYLTRNNEVRQDPEKLLQGAKSMIVCLFAYPTAHNHVAGVPYISSYAMGRDYHKALRKALTPVVKYIRQLGEEARVCIDSAPLRERYWAQQAGLGYPGLNGRLISPVAGCDFFIASVITTLRLKADKPIPTHTCLECGRCIKACPNGALDGHGGMDARRCISYQTIENRDEIPRNFNLAGHIFGCDLCSEVCPLSARPGTTPIIADLITRPDMATLSLADWLAMTPDVYETLFNGTPVRRASLEKLQSTARRLLKHKISEE